jgi:hypothetical protein
MATSYGRSPTCSTASIHGHYASQRWPSPSPNAPAPPALFDDIRARLKATMHPRHWSGVNGVSTELNYARDRALRAADATTDDDLRADYKAANDNIEVTINADHNDHIKEEGW